MSKFRLSDNVPDVYVNQSRDFQLLLRLYDSIFSGTKFDIDSMSGIINTSKSRNSILPLLSTKLGFFTNLEINDDKLRTILGGFPLIIRKKGSLLAIKETLNLYLKAEHIKCNIIVSYNSETTTIGDQTILDHTLSIGSDKTLKNPQILQEIFKYILPIGFRVRFYSFRSFQLEMTQLENSDDVIILYKVSANPFSNLRRTLDGSIVDEYQTNVTEGVHIPSSIDDEARIIAAQEEMLGAVGITELASSDDAKFPLEYCLRFSSDNGILSFGFTLNDYSSGWEGLIEYSYDRLHWYDYSSTNYIANNGPDVYLRGSNNTTLNSWIRFSSTTGNVRIDGNIEVLLDWQTVLNNQHPIMGEACFYHLFYDQTKLIKAPDLPATTLSPRCYAFMFAGSSITEAPELPATTLADSCYYNMFAHCDSLTTVPELPATTLAVYCYGNMFQSCSNLETLPNLPANKLPEGCYSGMFNNCSKIKLSETKDSTYTYSYKISASKLTVMDPGVSDMFLGTGGSFTGPMQRYTTYYTSNEII